MVFFPLTSIMMLPASAETVTPDYGIWLQTANSGNQQWAYYPYYGNTNAKNYSAANTGTDYFVVRPGTTILRKLIVQNKLSYNTNASLSITGLPTSWQVELPSSTPMILSGYYYEDGMWKSRPVGNGSQISPQGFSRVIITVPSNAQPGRYPYTIKASTYNATQGKFYNTTLTDAIVVGTGGYTPSPSPSPSPSPLPSPSPSPSPVSSFHEGFEYGYDKSVWVGGQSTNYRNDKVVVDTTLGHDGSNSVYGLAGGPGENIYCRAARNVSYGGHGFELSVWFYVNASEGPVYFDTYHNKWVGTSAWAGVADVPAERGLIDNIAHFRVVGYNNRTANDQLGYHIKDNWYRYFGHPAASGWYRGVITYDGTYMTFTEYDSDGNRIGYYTNNEPGFVPRAMLLNAGGRNHRIDDITYTTW